MKRVAECLYLNESSGTYFALVKRSGKPIRRSLKTQDRKLAERRLRDFRKNVGNLTANAEDRKIKFEALAERWLKSTSTPLKESSAQRNARCIKQIESGFKGKSISAINRSDCEHWISVRAKGVAARTSNYEVQVLKRLFQYAVDTGLILANPAITLKPRKERKKQIVIPSRDQFETLIKTLEAMANRDARVRPSIPLVKLLAFSGMRLGEATRIVWEEIDFKASLPVFTVSGGDVGTKNGEVRIVPLFPPLQKFLEELKDKAAQPQTGRIIRIESAKKALITACSNAGLPHFTHHCMRHFFVSNAIEKGIDFKTIASWVGHKDGGLLVAKTYGHLRDTHSHEMAKLM